MIEWRALINGCEFVSGYAFKGGDFNDESNGIPIIKIKNIQNDFVTLDTSQHISEKLLEKYKSNHKYKVYNDELLISMTGAGSVGRVGLTNINQIALLNQRVGKFVTDEINLNKEYLYHILTSDYFQRLLFNKGQGSGQPNLSPDEILEVEIPWPSYKDQVTIGKALHNLTSKIILLQAQNQTLEQTAQTIFKEWFGKYQIGDELPEGWRVGKLGEFIELSIGGDYGKEEVTGDFTQETICLRGTDLPDMKIGIPEKAPIRFLKASKLEKCKLEDGDIVIEVSGGTENQSTGRVMYINNQILQNTHLPITCVNFCRILRPNKVEYSYFIYSLFDYLYNRKVMFNWENGTTGIKNLNLKALLNSFDLMLPKSSFKIIEFNEIVKSSFIKIQTNNKQIQTLTQTRDTLLPKLMRGDIRVNGFKK